jgi:hypothetical protein
MKKARIFVLDSRNSKPLKGIALKAVLNITKGESNSQLDLGILSSDHKGYISFAFPDAILNEAKCSGLIISALFNPEISIDIWKTIADERFKSAIPFLIDGSLIPEGTYNDALPSFQSTDAIDWQLSPESFGSASYTMIGQGGCEDLLLSNAAIHTYRFSQLVRNSDEKNPSPLTKIKGSVDCEREPGFNNFKTIFNAENTEVSTRLPHAIIDPWYNANLTCYKLGALLEYELTWKPINHGLGEILYSLPLAPCESRKIAFIDWSREDKTYRDEDTSNTEQLLHNQRRDRIIDETVEGAISEWQRGGSVMGGVSVSGIGFTAAGAAGYSTSSGDRNLSAETVQNIADNVAQASSASRRFNSTVIVQASQAESQTLETRAVTNHNHCHALTVLYYEIVRHFLVSTSLVKKRDVVFVRYPILKFDDARIFENRQLLKEVLIDKSLIGCFNAFEKIYCTNINFTRHSWPTPADENELEELELIIEVGDIRPDRSSGHHGVSVSLVTKWTTPERAMPLLRQDILYAPSLAGDELADAKTLNGYHEQRNLSPTFEPNTTEIFTLKPPNRIQWKNIKGIVIKCDATWNVKHIKVTTKSLEFNNQWVLVDADGGVGERINRNYVIFEKQNYAPNKPEDILKDDEYCCKFKLVDHVNQNLAYYNRMLWLNEDAGERAIRFDHFNFDDGFRVIDKIENRIVGITGDYVAFPLTKVKGSFAATIPDTEIKQQILSIPTRGAFAEAKLGHCNSCETRDVTRYWDWQESPCDCDSPEISNISPISTAKDTNVTPTIPAASLNIAAPNEEPDPAGIGAVLNILGKSDIFRDMSAKEQVAGILDKLIDSSTQLKLQDLKNKGEQEKREQERRNQELNQQASRNNDRPIENSNPPNLNNVENMPEARQIADDTNAANHAINEAEASGAYPPSSDGANEQRRAVVQNAVNRQGGRRRNRGPVNMNVMVNFRHTYSGVLDGQFDIEFVGSEGTPGDAFSVTTREGLGTGRVMLQPGSQYTIHIRGTRTVLPNPEETIVYIPIPGVTGFNINLNRFINQRNPPIIGNLIGNIPNDRRNLNLSIKVDETEREISLTAHVEAGGSYQTEIETQLEPAFMASEIGHIKLGAARVITGSVGFDITIPSFIRKLEGGIVGENSRVPL